MTEADTPPPQRGSRPAPVQAKGVGGAILVFVVGALIVVAAAIGWFLHAGGRPAAPARPKVSLDMPEPRLPAVPDRPASPDLPRPIKPSNVTAPVASSPPGPET